MTCNLLKEPAFAHHRRGDERCIRGDVSIWRGAITIHVVDKCVKDIFSQAMRIDIERGKCSP